MQKILISLVLLLNCSLSIFAQVQHGQNIYGLPGDYLGKSVAISANSKRIAAGGNIHDGVGDNSGYVLVFDVLGDSLVQVGAPIEGLEAGDQCGAAVAFSATGNRIAVSSELARVDTIKPGCVRVFDWIGNKWIQVGSAICSGTHQCRFGEVIDMTADGKRIIIGSHSDKTDGHSGSVSVYEEISGEWQLVGQILRGAPLEQIGASVSITPDGHRIAFGRNQSSVTEIGFIRVYEFQNSLWQQVGADIKDGDEGDWLGASVSLSTDGKRVGFGAPENSDGGLKYGSAFVYEEVLGNWLQVGNAIHGKVWNAFFAIAVSLSGDGERLAVGAPFTGTGEITVYQLKDDSWVQIGESISDKSTNDYFGSALEMSPDGKWIVGGGWFNKVPGVNCGLVQVYSLPRIIGNIYHDLSVDCTKDIIDKPLPGRFASIEPGSILVKSDNRGTYSLDSLPPGQYTITFDTSGPWIPICPVTQHFGIPAVDTIIQAPSMGFESSFLCARPYISVVMPSITRCFDGQKIFVQVCNEVNATSSLNDPYVIMRLDPYITPLSANVPYEYIGNLQYKFRLNTLSPGSCQSFTINAHVSCNAILGQSLCIESAIFPSDTCRDIYASLYHPVVGIPCQEPYDGSDLDVEVACSGDSLHFMVSNLAPQGEGDMSCYAQMRIYRDEFLVDIDSVRLFGGEVKEFKRYADGYTWRIEADQHPMYPGWSRPSASIELCGDAQNWTAGLINYFNLNDLDPAFDIYCDQVRGSYDPNDKSAYPEGAGPEHYVLPNQQIEYLIRFENTGTDTARTIVIRDSLDKNLDLFSIVQGPSSHEHVFNITSPGIIEWYFPNIELPDSNINEAASHGFVSYSIRQKANLPDGVVLQNRAAIYFDYNDPVLTNSTNHTISNKRIISALPNQPKPESREDWKIYPNPTSGKFTIDFGSPMNKIEIEIFDPQGRMIHQAVDYSKENIDVDIRSEPGIYFLRIKTEDIYSEVIKLIISK